MWSPGWLPSVHNVVFLGPPGTGKTHQAIGIAAQLSEAHDRGRLQHELLRLGCYPLQVVDEVGYIPFEPTPANLFFQLVSARHECASLVVTCTKPFGGGVKHSATILGEARDRRPTNERHGVTFDRCSHGVPSTEQLSVRAAAPEHRIRCLRDDS